MRLSWWQWILAVVAAILLLLGLAYGIGLALPEEHTATVSAPIQAPPDSVWALITDVGAYPQWRPDVRSVTLLGSEGPEPAWRETTKLGALSFRTEEWDPPTRMTVRIADEGIPFGGTWTYEVIADGTGARLFITENGEVYHPLFRFMSRFVFGHEASIKGYLDAVREELESD